MFSPIRQDKFLFCLDAFFITNNVVIFAHMNNLTNKAHETFILIS